MRGVVLVMLVAVGCSAKSKCVSAEMKLDAKTEACGIEAARPREEVQKLCEGAKSPDPGDGLRQYLLEAPTCEALKLRISETVRKAEEEEAKDRAEQLKKQVSDQQKAFDKLGDQAKKAQEDAKTKGYQLGL